MMKAALFDLDGVIFDTEPQYSRFWGGECQRYFPDKPGLEDSIKGQTLVQIFDTLFAGIPDEHPRITDRLNAFEEKMAFDYVEGVQAFVEDLLRHGVKTAIVTSSNRQKMQRVHNAHPELSSLFDVILTAEDFARSKPSPDGYLKGAERVGVAPRECAGFEDSFNGLRAVRAAGMTVVGIATTNPRNEIAPMADIVADDFRLLRYNDVCRIVQ